MSFTLVKLQGSNLTSQVEQFNCGVESFNLFLSSQVRGQRSEGFGVTYLIVKEEEYKANLLDSSVEHITKVFGYATIATNALVAQREQYRKHVPAAEIRMFAIHKVLQGQYDADGKLYSDTIFKLLLQELYFISINIIGFKIIFLYANERGRKLYIQNNFLPIADFLVATEDEKIEIEDCEPLYMNIDDANIYSMFGC